MGRSGTKAAKRASERRRKQRRELEREGYSVAAAAAIVERNALGSNVAAKPAANMPGNIPARHDDADRQSQRRREERAERQEREERERLEAARQREEWEAETYARLSLDDSKHRPRTPDRLTTGSARVRDMTAVAVRRTKAMTKYEHDQLAGGR